MFERDGRGGGVLAALPPGPELLAALLAVAPADRDPASRIGALVGWERLAAWVAARQVEELAEFARAHPAPARGEPGFHREQGPVAEFAAAEVAAALALSPRSASLRLGAAAELVDRLPAVRDALAAGTLTAAKARLIAEHTRGLEAEPARAVAARVLARAERQTWAQLAYALRRQVLATAPADADQAYAAGRERRHVAWEDAGHGMAWLHLYDSADTVQAAWAYVNLRAQVDRDADRHARQARHDGQGGQAGQDAGASSAPEERSMDQYRADALAGLVGAGLADPALPREQARAAVQVIVPVGTLLGVDDPDGGQHPTELAGYGPIPTALARELAADAVWTRLLTDPATGALLEADPTKYQPPAALARFIRARDQTCRFPGCPTPAARCDLDHTVPHRRGGRTDPTNLGPLHRPHHRLRHDSPWRVAQPTPGTFVWTSPTGHVYTVEAEPLGPIDPGLRDRPPDDQASPEPEDPPPF